MSSPTPPPDPGFSALGRSGEGEWQRLRWQLMASRTYAWG